MIENLKAEIRKMENRLAEKERQLPALKISDALDAYFNDVNVSKVSDGTKKLYGEMMRRLERFVEDCGDKPIIELREITPTIVKSYLKDLKGKFKGATYNRYLKFYKRMWRILHDEARLTCNPWAEYKNQIIDVVPRRNLTIEELTKVIGSLDGEWRGLFIIGIYTGMRISDCCHLQWKNVDMSEKRLTVVFYKRRMRKPYPVQIPMHPDIYQMLSSVPQTERHGYVLPECASAYDRHSINYKVKRIFERCGIETNQEGENGRKSCIVGFHSLRSGFVTFAAEAGIPFPVIQEIVGHGSTRMTEHYFRTKKESLVECVKAIPSVVNPVPAVKLELKTDGDILSKVIDIEREIKVAS